jgi:hypothetical protein
MTGGKHSDPLSKPEVMGSVYGMLRKETVAPIFYEKKKAT